MLDSLLSAGNITAAIIAAIVGAIVLWRRDRREQRTEPITESTAILAQQKQLTDMALEMAEAAHKETERNRADLLKVRSEVDALKVERARDKTVIRRLLDHIRILEHLIAERLPGTDLPTLDADIHVEELLRET